MQNCIFRENEKCSVPSGLLSSPPTVQWNYFCETLKCDKIENNNVAVGVKFQSTDQEILEKHFIWLTPRPITVKIFRFYRGHDIFIKS